MRVYLDVEVRRVFCRRCQKVKQEKLDWLADSPFYTKRFAFYIGRRCRDSSIRDVAKEFHLDWKTVKALEKQYMQEQLRRAGTPGPKVIGIDEVSIRKGHTYRIVVSDLERKRPIWFGGADRSEKSLDLFYEALGEKKSQGVQLAVMDMWKAFHNSTSKQAPQAAILFDKFHVIRHLNEALDKVRKSEYARLSGKDRRFIKGQKYTLLSRRENLDTEGRFALRALLKANKRLNIAYLLNKSVSILHGITISPGPAAYRSPVLITLLSYGQQIGNQVSGYILISFVQQIPADIPEGHHFHPYAHVLYSLYDAFEITIPAQQVNGVQVLTLQ